METSGTETTPFVISTEEFDGPIDLLLHLVKLHELPIERLSLARVASQFVQCLENYLLLDVEVAGEYLVVAATLLAIKASYLVAGPEETGGGGDEVADEVEAPHEELLRRLKEAETYRKMAQELAMRSLLGVDVFEAGGQTAAISTPEAPLGQHDALLLGKALRRLLERNSINARSLVISVNAASIADRMLAIIEHLATTNMPLSFSTLVGESQAKGDVSELVSRTIATFLALLELCKRAAVEIRQEDALDEILVLRVGVVNTEFVAVDEISV